MQKNFLKRLFDIIFAAITFVLLLPIIGIVGFYIWIIMGKPILFNQQRPGIGGKLFTLYKFRTMTYARNQQGKLLPDANRLTPLGRLLRVSSLDELPELFNVLRGEMSLVGPRPLLVQYLPYYTKEERIRFQVRPGITGLSQVCGRNDLSWDFRLAKDAEYVRRCSFFLDMHIIAITILKVITRKGLRIDPGAYMLNLDDERKLEDARLRVGESRRLTLEREWWAY